jgi:hypothetical protein
MYLVRTVTNRVQLLEEGVLPTGLGPEFSQEQIQPAVKMEVWGTSFTDPGPDFCLFHLFDANGVTIATKKVEGY